MGSPSIIPASTRPWRASHPKRLWRLELEHVHPIWQGNQWLRNPHTIGEKCWKSPPAMGFFSELVEVKMRDICSWDFFSVCVLVLFLQIWKMTQKEIRKQKSSPRFFRLFQPKMMKLSKFGTSPVFPKCLVPVEPGSSLTLPPLARTIAKDRP